MIRTCLIFLLAGCLSLHAQSDGITSGDNWVVPTVISDASGNGNSGTNINAAISVDAQVGRGLSFNGTSQYVQLSRLALTNVTVCAWSRLNAHSANIQTLVGLRRTTSQGDEFGLWVANSNLTWYAINSLGTNTIITSSSVVPLGQWVHAVGVLSGTNTAAYINGTWVGGTTFSGGFNTTNNPNNPQIAHQNYDPSTNRYWNGSLDDIRIYNRALSSNEVVSVYSGSAPTNGLVGYWTLDDGSYQSGLVGRWPFEDNGGTTPDRSGNGNTGTLINTPAVLPGVFGTALQFNGTTQGIKLASPFAKGATSQTVTAWVRPTLGQINEVGVVFEDTAAVSSVSRISLGMTNRFATFGGRGTNETGALIRVVSTTLLPTDRYTFLAGVWNVDAGSVSLYINGALDRSTNSTLVSAHPNTAPQNGSFIGCTRSNTQVYAGSVDDVRIYNRALSLGEIAELAGCTDDPTTTGEQ